MQRWSRQTRSRLVWLGLAFVLPGVTGQGFLTGGARGQAGPATTARAAPFPDAAQRIARRAVAYSRGIPSTPAPEPAGGLGQAVFPAGEYPVTLPAVSLLGARNDLPNPYQPGVDWGELPAGRTWGSTASVTTAADGTIWASC